MLLMVSSNASVFQGGLRLLGNPPDLLSVFLMPMTGGVVCLIFFWGGAFGCRFVWSGEYHPPNRSR